MHIEQVDVDRPIEIARRFSCDVSVIDERKVDHVISELDRYQVNVVETKWFGVDAYRIGGTVVLTAGRDVPDSGQKRQRRRGCHSPICRSYTCVEGGW